MLRPYQKKAINQIKQSFEHYNSVMLQMPTGTGKTTVFSEFVRLWISQLKSGKRVLVLVHRKELVDQIISRLKSFGILAARIQSGYTSELTKQVQVGLIQSINKPDKLPLNVSLIIIDEAHHTPANSYKEIIKHYESSAPKLLGLTATPCRLNGEGFKDLFEKLITSNSIREFIEDGYLAPIKHLSFSKLDLSKIRFDSRKGDYNERDLEAVVRKKQVISDLIESYQKYASNKKAIVFALNKAHSNDIVSRFQQKGIKAISIDSDTKKEERDRIVNDFKAGLYKVLCNVNIFTEGFDCPDVEVVLLARPTKSFSLYLQQVGRVMRPAEGKEFGLIIDNASLCEIHGLVTQDIIWSLKSGIEKTQNTDTTKMISNNEITDSIIPNEISGIEMKEIDSIEIKNDFKNLTELEIAYCLNRFLAPSLSLEPLSLDTIKRQLINGANNYQNNLSDVRFKLFSKHHCILFLNKCNIPAYNVKNKLFDFQVILRFINSNFSKYYSNYKLINDKFNHYYYLKLFNQNNLEFMDNEKMASILKSNGHLFNYSKKVIDYFVNLGFNDLNYSKTVDDINNFHLNMLSSIEKKVGLDQNFHYDKIHTLHINPL